MKELFGRDASNNKIPLTADRATITWGGVFAGAVNLSVNYAQPVTIRHVIGNKDVVLVRGLPSGQISIGRILAENLDDVFTRPGWDGCTPANLTFSFAADCSTSSGTQLSFTATGALVVSYGFQTEAEGVMVMDNIAIQFVQLFKN